MIRHQTRGITEKRRKIKVNGFIMLCDDIKGEQNEAHTRPKDVLMDVSRLKGPHKCPQPRGEPGDKVDKTVNNSFVERSRDVGQRHLYVGRSMQKAIDILPVYPGTQS